MENGMLVRIAAAAALTLSVAGFVVPAHATSMADCSAKYKAAKEAGTLNGMKWNDFRKAECASDASTAKTAAGDTGEPTAANTEKMAEPAPTTAKAPAGVVFPKAVDAKFSNETPGKARMHTCLEQYKINKTNNTLGGMKWIQKGSGYYSICNTRLKQ
jgi:hypothetical protein